MKRIIVTPICLALLLCGAQAFAASGGGKVEYPKEWGDNLALADNGGQVIETSDEAYDPINLIDGYAGEGRHWEPLWDAGRPWYFIIELEKESLISIIRFDTESRLDSGGVPRKVDVSVSVDDGDYAIAYSGELPNESSQTIKLDKSVKAKFIKFLVSSDYGESGGEIGEVGVFGKAGVAGVMRGTENSDVFRFANGDVLSGNIQTDRVEIQASFAKLAFTRDQIAGIVFGASVTQNDTIVLINGDVVNGFISTATFGLKLASGSRIEVKQDKIAAIGYQIKEAEFVGGAAPSTDRAGMRGGDSLGGKFVSTTMTITTAYATLTVAIRDLASFEYSGGGPRFFRFVFKNGDAVQGNITEEKLAFKMTYGPEIPMPVEEIGLVTIAE